jgi:hypothetical protein
MIMVKASPAMTPRNTSRDKDKTKKRQANTSRQKQEPEEESVYYQSGDEPHTGRYVTASSLRRQNQRRNSKA